MPFDYSKYIRELPDKALIERIRFGVEFGCSAPSAIVVNAFDHDGRAYAEEEFYKRETTDEELSEAAKELQEEWGKGTFWCDARFP